MREIAVSGVYEQQHWGSGPYDYKFSGKLNLNPDGFFEGQITDMGTDGYPPLDTNPIPVKGIVNKSGISLLKLYSAGPPVVYVGDRILPYRRMPIEPSPENNRRVDFGGHFSFSTRPIKDEDLTQEQLTKYLEQRFDDILEVLGQKQEHTSTVWGMTGMPGVVTKSKRVIVLYRVGELHIIDDVWAGGGFDLSMLGVDESDLAEPSQEIQSKVNQIREILPVRS